MSAPVLTTDLPGFPRHQGKVRDIYDLGDHLLLVASDRISAFDVVMNEPIPDKGRILTALSAFWFRHLADIVPNHLLSLEVADFPAALQPYQGDAGRPHHAGAQVPTPAGGVHRPRLSLRLRLGRVSKNRGHRRPRPAPGLVESQQLPEPLFTPSTKAELGTHDENISFGAMAATVGAELAARVRDISLNLYRRALAWAEPRGIIIADTKFEFGLAAAASCSSSTRS